MTTRRVIKKVPLVLIPYLAADYACYAFQVAEYAKRFTCISVDPRGAGKSDKPEGVNSSDGCLPCTLETNRGIKPGRPETTP